MVSIKWCIKKGIEFNVEYDTYYTDKDLYTCINIKDGQSIGISGVAKKAKTNFRKQIAKDWLGNVKYWRLVDFYDGDMHIVEYYDK